MSGDGFQLCDRQPGHAGAHYSFEDGHEMSWVSYSQTAEELAADRAWRRMLSDDESLCSNCRHAKGKHGLDRDGVARCGESWHTTGGPCPCPAFSVFGPFMA
jgi:hypothetical protein